MKKNSLLIVVLSMIAMVFVGCGQNVQPPLYNWGNYVKSSTEYGVDGHNKEVIEKHLQELEKIISESEANKQRVAPGLYAEYGQILFEANQKEKAKKYFVLEKETYPESEKFIKIFTAKAYGEAL